MIKVARKVNADQKGIDRNTIKCFQKLFRGLCFWDLLDKVDCGKLKEKLIELIQWVFQYTPRGERTMCPFMPLYYFL